jgi:hypothetical protein
MVEVAVINEGRGALLYLIRLTVVRAALTGVTVAVTVVRTELTSAPIFSELCSFGSALLAGTCYGRIRPCADRPGSCASLQWERAVCPDLGPATRPARASHRGLAPFTSSPRAVRSGSCAG